MGFIVSEWAISLKELCFGYGKNTQSPSFTIDSLQIQRGDTVFLYGKSGSGKSTLLNVLSGVLRPFSGSLTVLDTDMTRLSASETDKFRARHVGVVFQTFNLISYLSVLKNIELAAFLANNRTPITKQRAEALLTDLHLPANVLDKPVTALSIGQQQRVAIVRALINQPEILLVDEPTSALDSDARDAFMQVLLSCVKKDNITTLFVSHDKALASHFSTTLDIQSLYTQKENV